MLEHVIANHVTLFLFSDTYPTLRGETGKISGLVIEEQERLVSRRFALCQHWFPAVTRVEGKFSQR